jgi:hypothetical protein
MKSNKTLYCFLLSGGSMNAPPTEPLDPLDPLVGPRPESWWTGPKPLSEDEILKSLPQLRLDHCTRGDVLNYFNNTWLITETLFSALQGEQAFLRAPYHSLRHPLIFYYAHPAVLAFGMNP